MIYSGSGDLPKHIYCWVDSSFIRKDARGFEPCVWFALHSHPGRAWGCHILLECGAVYRNVPPHALAFGVNPDSWSLQQAQMWDCYGSQFSTVEYTLLAGLRMTTREGYSGRYLFTAIPLRDGYSDHPEQAKEFMFCALDNGRLTIQPTNRVLFHDKSFCEAAWPANLVVSEKVWRAE